MTSKNTTKTSKPRFFQKLKVNFILSFKTTFASEKRSVTYQKETQECNNCILFVKFHIEFSIQKNTGELY